MTPTSTSTAQPGRSAAATTAAWQQALAAEHAAISGYGSLGPRLDVAGAMTARINQAAHRALREVTESALSARGVIPVPAQPYYPVPFPLTTPARARQFALQLENACANAWRYLIAVAATGPAAQLPARTSAQTALTASALRAARWRSIADPTRPSVAFPGI